jgi:hypothetical protein
VGAVEKELVVGWIGMGLTDFCLLAKPTSSTHSTETTIIRQWTLLIPSYTLTIILLTYTSYLALMAYNTPELTSLSLIVGMFPPSRQHLLVVCLQCVCADWVVVCADW